VSAIRLIGEASARAAAGEAGRPHVLMAAVAAILLAGLDLLGAVMARRYADHRSSLALVGGAAVFVLLFWVYGRSLAYAELATITFAWIAMLQVGVVVLDRFSHHTPIPAGKLVAMAAILVLQGYLLLGSPTGRGA
jgi:hypothetical protein